MACDELDSRQALFFQLRSTFTHHDPPLGHLNDESPRLRKIKAKRVLQLRSEGLSGRAIAASQQISRNSVAAVLEAADAAGLRWDDFADRSEAEV